MELNHLHAELLGQRNQHLILEGHVFEFGIRRPGALFQLVKEQALAVLQERLNAL